MNPTGQARRQHVEEFPYAEVVSVLEKIAAMQVWKSETRPTVSYETQIGANEPGFWFRDRTGKQFAVAVRAQHLAMRGWYLTFLVDDVPASSCWLNMLDDAWPLVRIHLGEI